MRAGSRRWASATVVRGVVGDSSRNVSSTRGGPELSSYFEQKRPSSDRSTQATVLRGKLVFLDGAFRAAPAGRRRLALAKVQSEIEQGVAAAGDGEYVRERRVAETLERLAANPGAAPATSFWVNASLRWNPSGFAIQSNETYRIEVRGCVEINQCVG